MPNWNFLQYLVKPTWVRNRSEKNPKTLSYPSPSSSVQSPFSSSSTTKKDLHISRALVWTSLEETSGDNGVGFCGAHGRTNGVHSEESFGGAGSGSHGQGVSETEMDESHRSDGREESGSQQQSDSASFSCLLRSLRFRLSSRLNAVDLVGRRFGFGFEGDCGEVRSAVLFSMADMNS